MFLPAHLAFTWMPLNFNKFIFPSLPLSFPFLSSFFLCLFSTKMEYAPVADEEFLPWGVSLVGRWGKGPGLRLYFYKMDSIFP